MTGLGVVSSIGMGRSSYAEGLRQGKSGISPITRFDASGFIEPRGGEVRDFVPSRYWSELSFSDSGERLVQAVWLWRLGSVSTSLGVR